MGNAERLRSTTEWGKRLYDTYHEGIALVEVEDRDSRRSVGTAFHVGEGVYITAAHVMRGNRVIAVVHGRQFGDLNKEPIASGPFFHSEEQVDVACFTISDASRPILSLGGHLDDWINDEDFLLSPTLLIGYPPIPLARSVPFAVTGEINAVVDLYTGPQHPHFIISTMARGGFSGAPVFVGYSEARDSDGVVLGIVTESLIANDAPEHSGFMAVLSVEPIYTCLEENDLLPRVQASGGFEDIFKVRDIPEKPGLMRGSGRVQKLIEKRFNFDGIWWTRYGDGRFDLSPRFWFVLEETERPEFFAIVAAELPMMLLDRVELFVDGVQVAVVEARA